MSEHTQNIVTRALGDVGGGGGGGGGGGRGGAHIQTHGGRGGQRPREAHKALSNDVELSARVAQEEVTRRSNPKVAEMEGFRRKLPAFNQRDALLGAIANSQVLVVSGETGCGKTTQLPQFVLEQELLGGRASNTSIICTQPRRISAISVAARVAQERGEALGHTVGYQIRLEAKRSDHTRLLFCTTGVLLRRLVGRYRLTLSNPC